MYSHFQPSYTLDTHQQEYEKALTNHAVLAYMLTQYCYINSAEFHITSYILFEFWAFKTTHLVTRTSHSQH